MDWNTIKKSIQEDIHSRNLKYPKIRLAALERVERLLKANYPKLIENSTIEFNSIDRTELKDRLSALKPSGRISSAESSIINDIYRRI